MLTKAGYLDCPTGISGDMCLGALIHAGLPLAHLTQELARLGIAEEYHLHAQPVHRNAQQATKFDVELTQFAGGSATAHRHSHAEHNHAHNHAGQSHAGQSHAHRHDENHDENSALTADSLASYPASQASRRLPEIEALIRASGLSHRVVTQSIAVFQRLAKAEGAVHGIPPEQVHFHEVGATDAIVDIVGTCIGLEYLGIERLYCSALPVGGGTVWAAHGRLPVPAPAVLKLWELGQVPIYSNGIERELVTPTGAALVTVLASRFGSPPPMRLQMVGLGAGSKELAIPNILRLWIGEAELAGSEAAFSLTGSSTNRMPWPKPQSSSQIDSQITSQTGTSLQQTVAVLETQIDDLNPQAVGYVMAELLKAGALDVFTQGIGMKKSRPGILLSVICEPERVSHCESILFRETTTLGIRCSQQQRTALSRNLQAVSTKYGNVQVKVAGQSGAVVNVQPEYEDCAQLARQHQVPWREVHRLALQSWYAQTESPSD